MRASSRPRSELVGSKARAYQPITRRTSQERPTSARARTPTASASPIPNPVTQRPTPSASQRDAYRPTQDIPLSHHDNFPSPAPVERSSQMSAALEAASWQAQEQQVQRRTRTEYDFGPRYGGVNSSSAIPTVAAVQPNSCLLTDEEVRELLDENDKLKSVEKEFWVLLHERESYQDEIKRLKETLSRAESQALSVSDNVLRPSTTQRTVDDILRRSLGSQGEEVSRGLATETASALSAAKTQMVALQLENESLKTALHECMDLMISEDLRSSHTNTIRRDGPVAVFLGWLRTRHDRGEVAAVLASTRLELQGYTTDQQQGLNTSTRNTNVSQPQSSGATLTAADRAMFKSLSAELQAAQAQVRALQQELDRTDLSRRQALEDCDHMRQQVEDLGSQLQQTTSAFRNAQRSLLQKQVQEQVASNNSQHGQGPGPSVSGFPTTSQLAHRNAEIHQARAQQAKAQREKEMETYALAEDTERIRRELARRSVSYPRNDEITVTMDEI